MVLLVLISRHIYAAVIFSSTVIALRFLWNLNNSVLSFMLKTSVV